MISKHALANFHTHLLFVSHTILSELSHDPGYADMEIPEHD